MPVHVPPVADERAGLLAFLNQQRGAILISAHGLTEEQARATPTPSTLSVGGMVKHLALAEAVWCGILQHRYEMDMEAFRASFRLGPEETLAGAAAAYRAASAATDAVVAGLGDLGQPVPVPQGVPWLPQDVPAWSVRWVLLHLIEETARHAGHADILRESVDGATARPLMAAVEEWPPSPFVEPWRPALQRS
jgi:uncharacterized damage-inducible protein DinB